MKLFIEFKISEDLYTNDSSLHQNKMVQLKMEKSDETSVRDSNVN